MAILAITGWRESPVTWSAWTPQARSELVKRLRKSIQVSPNELKKLSRRIVSRETLLLPEVEDRWVDDVTRILEAMGALVERHK